MEYVFDPSISDISNEKVDILNHLEKSLVSVISDRIENKQNSYIQVTTTLEEKYLNEYTEDEKAEIIADLQIILKEIFSQYYSSRIDFVDFIKKEDIYIFIPYTEFKTFLYANPNYNHNIDISKYVGYKLLSTSPLTRYICNNILLNENVLYIKTDFGYISLISRNINIDEFDYTLIKLEKEGYFAYLIGFHDLENREIIKQLCKMFEINIIDESDLSILICQTKVDFYTSVSDWIQYNIPIVKSGNFPIFTIFFDFSFFNDYTRLYGSSFRDTILKYVAYLAYARLSDEQPIISSSIISININEDLSINVSLPIYEFVEKFRNYMNEYLNNGISYSTNDENSLSGIWNIETCETLKEGILKRWIIQNVDEDAYPMIFLDKSGTEVLIHRSPLTIGDIRNKKFDFSPSSLKKAEEELTVQLREYYSKCHNNIEAVTLENINEMDLKDLLQLIPIEEKGKTFCFSNATIESLVKKENPLTRRPLDNKTILTQKYLDEGLRGLFDIGPLFGLYESLPVKENIEVYIGIPKVTREAVNVSRRDLVGNIFLVEIVFEDETSSVLFEISLPLIKLELAKELKEYVNILWYQGYFLSNWTSAFIKYNDDVKSVEIFLNSPVLLNASHSLYDGEIAFEMLKNATL